MSESVCNQSGIHRATISNIIKWSWSTFGLTAEYIISERLQSYNWFPLCRLRQSPFRPCPDLLHLSEVQKEDPASRTDTLFPSPTTSKCHEQQVTGGDLHQACSSWTHSGCAIFCNLYSCFKGWSDRWELPSFFEELCWTTTQIKICNNYPLKTIPFLQCNCNNEEKNINKQAETEFGHSVSQDFRRFKKHISCLFRKYMD